MKQEKLHKDIREPTSYGHAGLLGNHKPLFFLEIQCQWKHAEGDHLHALWTNKHKSLKTKFQRQIVKKHAHHAFGMRMKKELD